MGQYSIKDLEQLSGIKAHTLRIWEKRYEIISPKRTATNIRYYTDADLKKVLNIAMLNSQGMKISKIANLTYNEIVDHITNISLEGTNDKASYYIEQLIIAMVDLDERLFNQIVTESSSAIGFENTVTKILYPFLNKIGVLWLTGNINPAQEHFVSHLIKQKIIAATDALSLEDQNGKTVVLWLPENELHELGLLFANYLARKANNKTVYLGQSVPYKDLISVINTHHPDALISNYVSMKTPTVEAYLNKLTNDSDAIPHIISGYSVATSTLSIPENVKKYTSTDELIAFLKS